MSDSDRSSQGETPEEDAGVDGVGGETGSPEGVGGEAGSSEGVGGEAGELGDDVDDESLDAATAVEELNPLLSEPIEPGDPSAEHALFVFLGVLGTVGLLASAVLPGLL
jgi:hypothetical protein